MSGSSEPGANLGEDEEYIKITRRLQELDGATPSSDKMQTPDGKIPGDLRSENLFRETAVFLMQSVFSAFTHLQLSRKKGKERLS